MTDVILKGENHASQADHQEELDIMQGGIDALVLEGNEKEAEYRPTEGWFQQAVGGMFYILGPLYISKEILVEYAKLQEADLCFTRESDAEVLRNAPWLVRTFSAVMYFLLLPGSVIVGLINGYLWGAGFLLLSFGLPVLTIRIYNTKLNSGEQNRDHIMAQKITQAVQENDFVLAIVGGDHAEKVMEALPDDIEVDYRPPMKEKVSKKRAWNTIVRIFQTFSLLFTLYLAILWTSVNFLIPLSN